MNKIEIIEVSCPLVNGSLLPFYENSEDDEDNFVAPIREFISHLDLSKIGKIDIEGNTRSLVINLLQTDDFGAPPRSLAIRFTMNSKVYQISIPFSNSTFIYFDLVEDWKELGVTKVSVLRLKEMQEEHRTLQTLGIIFVYLEGVLNV